MIGANQRLFQIKKSFRMAKSDLAARPINHRTRDSIEAHLTIVFAALAVSRWIEDTTGWSIKKFVKTVRRYRTIHIHAGNHTITAADPLPDDIHQTLEAIHTRAKGTKLSQLGPHRSRSQPARGQVTSRVLPGGRPLLLPQERPMGVLQVRPHQVTPGGWGRAGA